VSRANEKVECFYTMLNFLLDKFVPVHRIRVTERDRLCSVRNWFDESVKLAVKERDPAYKVCHDNINRVKGDRFFLRGDRGYGSYMFRNADMLTAWLRESMVVLCQYILTLVFLNGSFTKTCVSPES
jgi:hypothetical protein